MFDRFTDRARRVVVHAQDQARSLGHDHIGTEHLLLGLLEDENSSSSRSLEGFGVTRGKVLDQIGKGTVLSASQARGHIPFTSRGKKVLELSLREALQLGHNYIGTEHILLGLIREGQGEAIKILQALGAQPSQVRTKIIEMISTHGQDSGDEDQSQTPAQVSTKSKLSTLDQYGHNLTEAARNGKIDPVVGRDEQITRVVQILSRRTKNNPVLIGEPGVGKTAVVEGLAQLIARGEVPETVQGKQIYTLDMGSIIAGARYRGDFEERLKKIINEVISRDDVILFIDEIHTLVGAGAGEGSMDASNLLKPMMARGQLRVVGATTLDEYRKYVEKDAALERRFQTVQVPEPSLAQTVEILRGLRDRYEAHHDVTYTDAALNAAARLSHRYISDRFLPDKAIDLLDEAGAYVRLTRLARPSEVSELDAQIANVRREKEQAIEVQDFEKAGLLRDTQTKLAEAREGVMAKVAQAGRSKVDEELIAEVLARTTGIPVTQLSSEESSRLLNMEAEMHKRVVGQQEAIVALSKAIRRSRAGLKDPNRPGGSFIFAGPSGVGKTELCKALAEFLFGDEDSLITLDMSEYAEKHTASRLFGAPPGFVGYEEGGQLTEKVRRKPFSVILFDEVEKAHPDIFNSLLQVLDEGRLTDSQGRVVDFKNTVIVMTSNLGTRDISKSVSTGFGSASDSVPAYEQMKSKVMTELKAHFRPEFLNRIDDIVVFPQLSREEIVQVVEIMADRLDQRLRGQDMGLELSAGAKAWLAKRGYDPVLGARPMRRLIQREVEDVISEKILYSEFGRGSLVFVDVEDDGGSEKLTFQATVTGQVPDAVDIESISG